MTFSEYTLVLNKPETVNEQNLPLLESIIDRYPYFQSARVVQLKQLYNQQSYQYNHALKLAAAYTTDRSVLFDFITSTKFVTLQNKLYDQKVDHLFNINVSDFEVIESKDLPAKNSLENSIASSISIADKSRDVQLTIGKPLPFSVTEKHSFQEWLQLSRVQPISRAVIDKNVDPKTKQESIIDKFIATNPKIPALEKNAIVSTVAPTIEEKSYLMTETLAKVYLEQKKYQRAIQAYEILILKYPEKSSYFADSIFEIKKIQQNNNS